MAFLVEDGSGLENANSLIDIAFADEYFMDRGNTVWPNLSDELKKSAAILGTSYVSTQYNFRGEKLNIIQGTAFPRKNVFDPSGVAVTGIPRCVLHCVCEMAVRASQFDLIPDPVFDEDGRAIKSVSRAAEGLKESVTYAGPGELVDEARFPAVDALMCPWLVVPRTKFANGVKAVAPSVTGVSNSNIAMHHGNTDRYTGPMDENGRDVGGGDGNSIV